ncbi:hypothetical protein [Gimesia maris]|uniref:hypothetical protein n=1 Tax=Gimesia maris TaxID=122 RepID=UPI0032EFB0B0
MFEKIKAHLNQNLPTSIIVALLTFTLTYYFSNKYKEISYVIEPTDVFLKNPLTNKVEITVNGIPVKEVFSHRIKILNSGDLPVTDVPFTFSFPIDKKVNTDFKIINLSYSTIPRMEFGKIEEVKKGDDAMGMKVALLNPGDEINVSIITNQDIQPEVYSKAEGVFVYKGTNSRDTWFRIQWIILFCGGGVLFLMIWNEKKESNELDKKLSTLIMDLGSNIESIEERIRNAAFENEVAREKLLARLKKLSGETNLDDIPVTEEDNSNKDNKYE